MKTTIDFFCIAISYLRRGGAGRDSAVMSVCEGAEIKSFETERSDVISLRGELFNSRKYSLTLKT